MPVGVVRTGQPGMVTSFNSITLREVVDSLQVMLPRGVIEVDVVRIVKVVDSSANFPFARGQRHPTVRTTFDPALIVAIIVKIFDYRFVLMMALPFYEGPSR